MIALLSIFGGGEAYAKWKLLLTTVSLAVGVIALALVREYVLRIPPLMEFTDLSPLLTSTALIIGFMLAGVMADYKESEKLPAEIATSLQALDDALVILARIGKPIDLPGLKEKLHVVSAIIEDWLMNRVSFDTCRSALGSLNDITVAMDRAGAPLAYTSRGMAETTNLRRALGRIHVIRRTTFIQTGYALLDVLVGVLLLLLILANFKTPTAQCLLIALLSLIYVYMIRLIRDLDNPFDYPATGGTPASTEVDLDPVLTYRQQLKTSLAVNQYVPEAAVPTIQPEASQHLPQGHEASLDRR